MMDKRKLGQRLEVSALSLGAIASRTGFSCVFLASAVVVFGAAFIAAWLVRARSSIDEVLQ